MGYRLLVNTAGDSQIRYSRHLLAPLTMTFDLVMFSRH
jgi:hypothetical protein